MNKMKYGLLKTVDRTLIKIYIFIRVLQCNIKRYEDVNVILDKYENLIKGQHYELKFSFFYDFITTQESMCLTRANTIVANPAWAAKLVLFNNPEIEGVFFITAGHEMTHIEKEFSDKHLNAKNRKFVKWVNEVHADFAAAEKMVGSSKEKLIKSIDYKIAVKPNNTDSPSHPSWKQRKLYAEIGAFNRKLIDIIALDTDCTNITLIEEVSCFYKDIILMD